MNQEASCCEATVLTTELGAALYCRNHHGALTVSITTLFNLLSVTEDNDHFSTVLLTSGSCPVQAQSELMSSEQLEVLKASFKGGDEGGAFSLHQDRHLSLKIDAAESETFSFNALVLIVKHGTHITHNTPQLLTDYSEIQVCYAGCQIQMTNITRGSL